MVWIAPVTDHYQGQQYTQNDMNRVGNDIQYLADLLNGYGYTVTVSPKTDWMIGDIPSVTQMSLYLVDLNTLKAAFYGSTTLPAAMDNIDHEDANNIEKLLLEVEEHLAQMTAALRYCGELICGEDQ